MKQNKKKYLTWVLLLFGWGCLHAQIEQVVAANGQQLSGSNGQVSFTVGEPAITTLSSANNQVSQGYQQSNLTTTAIEDVSAPPYQVSVYPNPTGNQLTVMVQGLDQQLVFQLYDIQGKLLYETTTTSEKSELDFTPYAPGQYLLQLSDRKGNSINRQQIIKTN